MSYDTDRNSATAYRATPHSTFGIAALGLSLVTVAAFVVTLVTAVLVTLQARGQGGAIAMEEPRYVVMFCSGLLSVVLAVPGLLLGLAGCNRKDRRRRPGAIAVVVNVAVVLGARPGIPRQRADPRVPHFALRARRAVESRGP